ncbi:VrrA/YqfQ family protein [Neobacillus niacini]|uniref:VrrA/YqfQ family protein n=1 Tax=Neobacillus niacini TaxID=86668 RepID=UPI003983AA58
MQQPRPRYPLHGRMGPNMMGRVPYGGHQQMMNPYGGNGTMMGYQQNFHNGSAMIGQTMGRGQGRRNGGGLLSKILGGKKQGNQRAGLPGLQSAPRSGQGGVSSILQTLSNPESLTGFLNNTQQVLKTAQSIGPMIQQYGPIVKNLPMMWKLYKGFKDLPSEDQSVEDKTESLHVEEQSIPVEEERSHNKPKRKKNIEPETEADRKQHRGPSMPKLYI